MAGLAALMLFHDARRDARVAEAVSCCSRTRTGPSGTRGGSPPGAALLDRALTVGRPGPYQLQAAISGLHCDAPHPDATDWRQITLLYGELYRRMPRTRWWRSTGPPPMPWPTARRSGWR